MNRQKNNDYSKAPTLKPLRCPHCHKLLLTEEIEKGALEITCKRCRTLVRLEATKQRKIIKMRS